MSTTDPFTEARAEDDDHECTFVEEQEPSGRPILGPCLSCGLTAMDALDHLRRERSAAQEPTGDEHYAAAQVIYEATTEDGILKWPHVSDEETARCMNLARAALSAARAAGRDAR